MNAGIHRQYHCLQDDLLELLKELDKLPFKKLESAPAMGKWSVTQVMYHLNQAESLSVLYVSKKRLAAGQLKPTGFAATLRLMIARISFYLPIKYNAPKVLGAMPETVLYPEMKARWLSTRKDLFALLDSLNDEELRKPIFKQPTFGRWNIYQMLGFMQTHFNRHRKQIRRTVELIN